MRNRAQYLRLITSALLATSTAFGITTAGDPNDPRYSVFGGSIFDGTAIVSFTFPSLTLNCSGALLSTGGHMLTAAHCATLTFFSGDPLAVPSAISVTFNSASGSVTIPASSFTLNPSWDRTFSSGTDIAVITLASPAPSDVHRYDIYRGTDEIGKTADLVGIGYSGTGSTGITQLPGTRLHAQNIYDTTVPNGRILLGDFDNGLSGNDYFGTLGIPNLGLGLDEGDTAAADSGGPTFIDGKIAGIHTYIDHGGCPTDIVTPDNPKGLAGCKIDSSFGEYFGDTRVSSYTGFVDSVTGVPEPSTVALFSAGLAILGGISLRRRCESRTRPSARHS